MLVDMFTGVLFSKTAPRTSGHLFLFPRWMYLEGKGSYYGSYDSTSEHRDDKEFQHDKEDRDWMDG